MSLNGLEAEELKEAYQSALKEGGGWFLLQYKSRDEVELLGKGNGGVGEIHELVDRYEEASPLFGFIHYRRRKIVLKYVPEETSRLLQARLSVHFQSITEWLTPYDAVFTFSKSTELSDSALLSSCSLHAAASSKSSNDPNASRGLAGISEDASEGQQNGKQTKVEAEEFIKREKGLPPSGGDGGDGDDDDDNDEDQENRANASRGLQRSRTLSNANKNLPLTPNHPTSRQPKISTAFEPGDFDNRPSFEARMSTQSERPSTREINRAYEYKQKVKLGPRPSIDLGSRQEAPGMSRDSIRPKATLPAGLRMPTRKAASGPAKAHSSPKSHTEKPQVHPNQLSAAPPPPMTSLSDGKNLLTNFESNVSAASLDPKAPKMTLEKKRLMKALQIRQKHIETQNAAKGLGISIEQGEENAPELVETDGGSPVMPKPAVIPEKKAIETEQPAHKAHDIQDSPYSNQETSEGLSTRASSIHDEEALSAHKQEPSSESKASDNSKAIGGGARNSNTDMQHLVMDERAHSSRNSDVRHIDQDDAEHHIQFSGLPLASSIPWTLEEPLSDDRKPTLQKNQRLSGLSSSTIETVVKQPHNVLGTFSSDGGNSVSSPISAGSQNTTSVHIENPESVPTHGSGHLVIGEARSDSLGINRARHVENTNTFFSSEPSSAPALHLLPANAAVGAGRSTATDEGTSGHLEPKSNPDSLPELLEDVEAVRPGSSSNREPPVGNIPEPGSVFGQERLGSDARSLNSNPLTITESETLSVANGIHGKESQVIQDLPEQAASSLKVQGHEMDDEREHTGQNIRSTIRSSSLPRSLSLSSEEQDQPQASQTTMEAWNAAAGSPWNKQADDAPELTTAEIPSHGQETLIQKLSKTQESDGFGGSTVRKARRRGFVNPIHKSVSEQSEEQFLSDDSFMEELKSAKVEEAKPISVSKSPIKPVFSRSESDYYRIGVDLKTFRNVSSPLDCRQLDDATATSPPRPAPLAIRSFSAVSQPRFDPSSPTTSQVSQAKKAGVSSGISQRIKALEKLSSRPNSPITPSSSTPSFLNFPKTSFLPGGGPSDINTGFAGRHRPSTASASPVSSPDSAKPNPFNQPFSSPPETISVTATIIREPEKRPDPSLSGSRPSNTNLYRSPLKVERESKESASRQVMGPPPPPTPRSPVKSPRPKYSRYSSAKSVDSASTDHKGESSHTTRRSSFASKRSLSSRNGSDVDLPRSMSEKSLTSNALNGIHEEKKESRGSRLLKRMSSVTLASRRSIAQAISPNRKTEAISEQQEPAPSSQAMTFVDLGDVNVQFPDNLLWKRRHLVIDESGTLSLSASMSDKKTKVISKSYMLSEFKPPYIPDQDREELPNSVVLDFNDGSTLQCACEHGSEQAHLLKVLNQLYAIHCRI